MTKTIGSVARAALKTGSNNAETLAAVLKAFPAANTKMASIHWYRNDLRKRGEKVSTERDLKVPAAAKKVPAKKIAAKVVKKSPVKRPVAAVAPAAA